MKWSNVKLIFLCEFRDQMRDRRTLFTIAVLPLLLYPLLGMSFLQFAQFLKEHPTKILIVGSAGLPETPQLLDRDSLDGDHFSSEVCSAEQAKLLQLTVEADSPVISESVELRDSAQDMIQAGEYDAVVYFPADFASRLQRFQDDLKGRDKDSLDNSDLLETLVPQPEIFVNSADDKSRIAFERVARILRSWREIIVQRRLVESNVPIEAAHPFEIINTDVAEEVMRRAAIWSKILPFVVLIWALTGAFYPAIDLCAGEKERGTLETLLTCPAERSEIVSGKLLTVMVFSMATALLNLFSMGITGSFIMSRMSGMGVAIMPMEFGPPPLASIAWLILALIPISALFSALSLAIAAFARSTKEGQYYLMPLLLITLPLMMLSMLPTAELDLGSSLIPVTGMMLLLRELIEGQYREALVYAPPVIGVTALCCFLAVRWAIDQFQNESVLFRESERWGPKMWLNHLVRDRVDTPTFGEAILCGLIILLVKFFASLQTSNISNWNDLASNLLITQIALIAAPALLMAVMLTRSPRKTLLLNKPRWIVIPAAVCLAVCLHPAATLLSEFIIYLYPIGDEVGIAMKPIVEAMTEAPLVFVLLTAALTPALCEELAYRGFILSGLRHMGHKWGAIVLSSIFFGAAHGLLQQSLSACVLGAVIGYIAVQSGSILPCIAYHFTHNSIAILMSRMTTEQAGQYTSLNWIFHSLGTEGVGYNWPYALLAFIVAAGLLVWFRSLSYKEYAEEALQRALDHQAPQKSAT